MFRNIFSKFNIAVLLRGKLIKLQHSTLYTAIATQSKIVSLFELRTDCGPKFVQVVIYLTNKTIWTKYKKKQLNATMLNLADSVACRESKC